MKLWKKVLASVTAGLLCCSALPMTQLSKFSVVAETADTLYYGEFLYSINDDGTITITGYDDQSLSSLKIPSTIDGAEVTCIGDNAFSKAVYSISLINVDIPDSIRRIGDNAFSNNAFLDEITIPESVQSIGYKAFSGTRWLEVEKKKADYVSVNNIIIDSNAEQENITIPDTCTGIAGGAFENHTKLKNVTIPNSVKAIGKRAFSGCENLTKVVLPDGITKITEEMFSNCSSLNNVVLPNSVLDIENSAFSGCSTLSDICLASGLTGIGMNAFSKCNSLENITIPDSVDHIDEGAFSGCVNLKEISIPDKVTKIESSLFSNCLNLANISLPIGITSIGDNAFSDCSSIETFSVPDNVKSIGKGAFYHCEFLARISLPDGLDSIGKGAFQECKRITTITIPESVISLGDDAFSDCVRLHSITVPGSIKIIPNNCFKNCSTLDNVILMPGIESIYMFSFLDCTNMEKIVIPMSVHNINSTSFRQCTNLTVYGYGGSYAQTYAQKNKIRFIASADPYNPNPVTTTTTTLTTTTKTTTKLTTTKTISKTTTSVTTTTAATTVTTTTTTPVTTTTTETTTAPTTTTTKATTTHDRDFAFGADNWSFLNSRDNFGSNYFILKSYYDKLINGLNNREVEYVKDILSGGFGGSCYGMAVTSLLGYYGILQPDQWQSDANFVHDIDSPPNDEVISLINYYFALQMTDVVQQETRKGLYMDEKEKINLLENYLKEDNPVLISFYGYFYNVQRAGHAVVAYDVEYGTWVKNNAAYNGRFLLYDNNFESCTYIYFNSSSGRWIYPEYELDSAGRLNSKNELVPDDGAEIGKVTNDLNILNYHGYIDGADGQTTDNYIAMLKSTAIASDYSLRKINYNGNGWTINATADDDDIKMFAPMHDNMQQSNDVQFALRNSNTGYLMQLDDTEAIDLSMDYENSLLTASASNANKIVFDPSGYVEVGGDDTEYSMDLVFNEGYYPTDWFHVVVDGNNVDSASIKQVENGYILSASNLNNVSVKANNKISSAQVTFSTDKYQSAMIYEINDVTIGIAVDTDGNGTYETTIAQSDSGHMSTAFYGDINLDGRIDITDAVLLNKHCAGSIEMNADALQNADCDGDKEIGNNDAIVLLKFLVQLVPTLPYSE